MMRRARKKHPAAPLRGRISVPGDKSISHRALILSALARGRGRIVGVNVGDDVVATADALAAMGAASRLDRDKAEVEVEGPGWDGLREPGGILDCRNSGTALRLLAGVCAAVDGHAVLTGDESLRRRPMLRVVAPLPQMGATIDGREHGDRAPLAVRGGALAGIDLEMTVASAQVKSAVLLAGLRATGRTSVTEPRPSRDHTERMLGAAGVTVGRTGTTVSVDGGADLQVVDRKIPGDISSALFLIVAALLVPSSELEIEGVGLNPTRTAALDVLGRMGAVVEVEPAGEEAGEPVGTVRVRSDRLAATEIGEDEAARLIDEVPILAVAASQAEGETVITGARELRVKESDRIEAMAAGLGVLGANVEVLPDGLVVRGPTPLSGGNVESFADHRVALALAVAGLVASEKVRVAGWHCVETSFPEFLDILGRAQGRRL